MRHAFSILALVLAACGPTNLVVDPDFTAAKVDAWTIGTGLFDVKNGVARLEVTQAGFPAVASQKIAVELGQEYNLNVRFGTGGAGIVAIGTAAEGTDVITLTKASSSGDFVAARERFTDLRGRFPASAPAALAAFELGRMAFDVDADYRTAGDWFDRYLNEAPRGGLTREAQGRLLEARFRSKDADRALRAAAKYLLAYPEGPHARLARRVLDGEAP